MDMRTKELLTSGDEVIHQCAVVTCPEVVCDEGEVCGKHGTVCPSCLHETTPYCAQVEWWQSKYWACDNCDREIPGFVPAEFWDCP